MAARKLGGRGSREWKNIAAEPAGVRSVYSTASWYRDYVAYCGVSEDGKKLFAMVAQVGRRKPVLKKAMGKPGDDAPDSECPAPKWERAPARVTFEPDDTQKLLFSIRGRVIDLVVEAEEDVEE